MAQPSEKRASSSTTTPGLEFSTPSSSKVLTPSKRISFWRILRRSWKLIFAIILPIALLPLLKDPSNKKKSCLFVLILMVLYWMLEPINLYMTSFLPVALFPLLGIASSPETSAKYMTPTNMMFVGGLIIGIALEHCNLHRRIALKVIILFGSSLKNLMAGVMCVTAFLSMWINNTATTAMMVPIVDSILSEIMMTKIRSTEDIEINEFKNKNNDQAYIPASRSAVIDPDHSEVINDTFEEDEIEPDDNVHQEMKLVRTALLLSIAYSSNIGGTATLTGTGTNLVFEEAFHNRFEKSDSITFTSWFLYAFPAAIVTLIGSWFLLYLFFLRKQNESKDSGRLIKESALKKYEELGNVTFHEYGVMFHFIILVILWFLRDPEIFHGWADLFTTDKRYIKDAVPAFVIAISLFIFPANLTQFYKSEKPKEPLRLLNWKTVQTKMSWGVIFLLGGGFALSLGIEKSGLNDAVNEYLNEITWNIFFTTVVLSLFAATITEFASNVATANVLLPVILEFAVHNHVNPLYYSIPVTICISFAFMFPVATPPNAIVFEQLNISTMEMVKPGIFMNIISVTIQLIFLHTLGNWSFGLDQFPEWATSLNKTLTH